MRLKKEFIANKLVAIDSDLAEPRLGLSDQSFSLLNEKVSIIFHVAASVKFEAPLEVNMKHNVVATKELLEVACHFKRLQCFIHVSTAYSNCQLRTIDECIYPMDVPEDPLTLEVTKEMIDDRPNTYTYTKAMAENVASKYADRINVVIVRPSITMSALKEPAEGWVDTINGPVGLSVLGALGILQKIKVNSEVVFDLIPVDIVANAIVSVGWAAVEKRHEFKVSPTAQPCKITQTAGDNNNYIAPDVISSIKNNNTRSTHNNSNNNNKVINTISKFEKAFTANSRPDGTVRVFNLTTGSENPCSFYHYFSTGREEALRKPSERALRPLLTIPKQKGMNPIQYWIHKVFSHLLFAYILDTLLALFGQKKMVVKAVNRMHHANEIFDFFCSNQWHFNTDNVKHLRELQSADDRQEFNCDVRAIDWSKYAQIGWLGCRRFILKEDDDTFEAAKQRYRKICFMYHLVKVVLLVSITAIVTFYFSSSLPLMSMLLLPAYGIVYLL